MSAKLIINLVYVVSSLLFIVGLKKLSSPATARKGNLISSLGMFIAIVATLFLNEIISLKFIMIAVLAGSIVGVAMARLVAMTSMPEMVALLNGFGGLSSLLVGVGAYFQAESSPSVFFAVVVDFLYRYWCDYTDRINPCLGKTKWNSQKTTSVSWAAIY